MLVALGITLLAVSGALTTLSAGVAVPEMADRVAENASAVALGSMRCLAFVVLAGGLVLLYQRQRITRTVAAAVLGILVAADLWSVERLYWHFSPPASVSTRLTRRSTTCAPEAAGARPRRAARAGCRAARPGAGRRCADDPRRPPGDRLPWQRVEAL